MTNTKSTQSSDTKSSLGHSGIKRIIQVFVTIFIMGTLLFISAGRFDWPEAWIYTTLFLFYMFVVTIWGVRKDPDLMNERGTRSDNVKSWDRIIMAIRIPIIFCIPVLAGLDAVRFEWSEMSLIWQVIGFIGLVPAMVMPVWAMSANPFLSAVVRIQDDRGHQVATSGPYRFVRHPMYVGTILFGPCTSLLLGSWWALIPGSLLAALFVIRTALEDRMLHDELQGYADYARNVRYRLVPGVW